MTIPTPLSGLSITDVRAHWLAFLITGIIMVLLGMLALILPNISSLGVEQIVGWLLVVGGAVRCATLIKKQHLTGYWWSLLAAVTAIILGACLLVLPLQGVLTLAMLLTMLFAIEGFAAGFRVYDLRRSRAPWGWTLVSGIINLGLARLIWMQWPSSAVWIVGLYAGISLIFIGAPLIVSATAARTLAPA